MRTTRAARRKLMPTFSSTNSRHTAVLMRVKNSTGANINWPVQFFYTSYTAWGERASAALNGTSLFLGADASASTTSSLVVVVPPNRTSTFIVIAASSPPNQSRTNFLAFINNSLSLPSGLSFVDDLDALSGSIWTQ